MLIDYLLVERVSALVPGVLRRAVGGENQDNVDFRKVAAKEGMAPESLVRALSLAALAWFGLAVVSVLSTLALLFVCKAIVNTGVVHTPWFLMPLAAMSVLTLSVLEYSFSTLRGTSARNHISSRGSRKVGTVDAKRRFYPKWYDFWISAAAAAALFFGLAVGVVFK